MRRGHITTRATTGKRMSVWKTRISLLGLAALAVANQSPARGQQPEPIVMGVTFDAAKQASYYALLMKDATIARVDEINASGGVLGRPIRLLLEDDENNPAVASQKVEKLAAAGAVFIY